MMPSTSTMLQHQSRSITMQHMPSVHRGVVVTARLPNAAPLRSFRNVAQRRRATRDVRVYGLFGLGLPEIAVIAGVAALIWGPSKLPELGMEIVKCRVQFVSCLGFKGLTTPEHAASINHRHRQDHGQGSQGLSNSCIRVYRRIEKGFSRGCSTPSAGVGQAHSNSGKAQAGATIEERGVIEERVTVNGGCFRAMSRVCEGCRRACIFCMGLCPRRLAEWSLGGRGGVWLTFLVDFGNVL